jgi:predicted alpha/beta hydrolase family esterase
MRLVHLSGRAVSDPRFVFLAGVGNSEPDHWQRRWYQAIPGALWVEHDEWERISRDRWMAELDAALAGMAARSVLVAHSLGCLLAADWLREHRDERVAGAFLVAPPDVEAPCFPRSVVGFRAAPRRGRVPLPCPSMVVASSTDRYASIEHARDVAAGWGASIVDVGDRGHINLASDLGDWDEGQSLMRGFVASLRPACACPFGRA